VPFGTFLVSCILLRVLCQVHVGRAGEAGAAVGATGHSGRPTPWWRPDADGDSDDVAGVGRASGRAVGERIGGSAAGGSSWAVPGPVPADRRSRARTRQLEGLNEERDRATRRETFVLPRPVRAALP